MVEHSWAKDSMIPSPTLRSKATSPWPWSSTSRAVYCPFPFTCGATGECRKAIANSGAFDHSIWCGNKSQKSILGHVRMFFANFLDIRSDLLFWRFHFDERMEGCFAVNSCISHGFFRVADPCGAPVSTRRTNMEVRKSPVGPMPKCPSPLPRWKLVILLSKERSNDWQNYGPASRKIYQAPLVFESWYWFSLKIQAKGWVWRRVTQVVKNWCTLMYWELGYNFVMCFKRLCCELECSNLVAIIRFTNSRIICWIGIHLNVDRIFCEALLAAVLFQRWMEMNNCFAQLVVY